MESCGLRQYVTDALYNPQTGERPAKRKPDIQPGLGVGSAPAVMLIEGRQAIGPTVAGLQEFGISVHAAGLSEASSKHAGCCGGPSVIISFRSGNDTLLSGDLAF